MRTTCPKILILLFLTLKISSSKGQYAIAYPTSQEIYAKAKSGIEDELKQYNIPEKNVKMGYIGQLARFCDKLYLACEGDVYNVTVTIETPKDKNGVSYIGKYDIRYCRNDFGSCKLGNKWEIWSARLADWVPVGKKSGVTTEAAALVLLKRAIDEKQAFKRFRQYRGNGIIREVISMDNIKFNPKEDPECDFRKSDLKDLKSKAYAHNEVLAFYAELKIADFDTQNDSLVDIIAIEKVPCFINLWLDNNLNIEDISIVTMNCWKKELFNGKGNKPWYDTLYAWASRFPSDYVINRTTALPFPYTSYNYRNKFLTEFLKAFEQIGKDKEANRQLLTPFVSANVMDEWLSTIELVQKSKGQFKINNSSNAGQNMPIYSISVTTKKNYFTLGDINVWREENYSYSEGKIIQKLKNG